MLRESEECTLPSMRRSLGGHQVAMAFRHDVSSHYGFVDIQVHGGRGNADVVRDIEGWLSV